MLGEELAIESPELCKIYYGETNEYKDQNKIYPNNRISTTKYTLVNFFPKSLLLQFRKSANIYFLLVTILTFGSFSPINPASMIGTFIFVLICTMIKEAYEDFRRYQQDEINNNRLILKYVDRGWKETKSWTLVPGDIIKIMKNEELSADVLILKTSNLNGYAYIETKSLDGETNLKEKIALEEYKDLHEENYGDLNGVIICDYPNENLNLWNGQILEYDREEIQCDLDNIVLKGCVLKIRNIFAELLFIQEKILKL